MYWEKRNIPAENPEIVSIFDLMRVFFYRCPVSLKIVVENIMISDTRIIKHILFCWNSVFYFTPVLQGE